MWHLYSAYHSLLFFWKRRRNEYFIQQLYFKCIKSESKEIMVHKISISNKCCCFELSIHQRILKKNIWVFKNYYAAKPFSKLKFRPVSWAPNQDIRMLSEGSCDTEDCSNGCWKFSFAITGINDILKYIQVENSYLKFNNTSQYYCF